MKPGGALCSGVPDPNVLELPSSSFWLLRFGTAMARLRSKHSKEVKRDAKKKVRVNLKGCKSIMVNHRASAKWTEWANLKPAIDFFL